MKTLLTIAALLLTTMGCVREDASATFIEAHAQDYLEDATFRRAQLEASLWRPQLPYARKRLAGYALPEEEGGWDLLPELGARVMPVTRAQVERGLGSVPFEGELLRPEVTPRTQREWEQLGERVFWRMPMRRDVYLEWVVERPEHWEAVGLEQDESGALRGIVRFEDARGRVRVGATCALCHGAGGEAGVASRSVDLGMARVLFARARGAQGEPFEQWGPGRVDVTDDEVMDALAIPDLFGAKYQAYLNSSGAVKVESPASLATRFETQYIVGHGLEARPDRRFTWALAAFVLSLEDPSHAPRMDSSGARVFTQHCAGCHVPEQGFSGGLVPAMALSVSPVAAQSVLRGTGYYKVPGLIGIGRGGPYFHDASAPTLGDVLDSEHPSSGVRLEDAEREALLQFLSTL